MLASKFFDDVYYNNAYYARVGGISNSEVRLTPTRSRGRARAARSRQVNRWVMVMRTGLYVTVVTFVDTRSENRVSGGCSG